MNDKNKYENKCIRFYDKTDHYELWFMDEFIPPTSGKMWEGGSEYSLICDVIEDLHNGDASKELHIFIWSLGGMIDVLSSILESISRYRRTVAVNMGCADSCGWILFFSCDERYASGHAEFMYHEPSFFCFGKTEETASKVVYERKRLDAILVRNENVQRYLTSEEKKKGETTEVWLTGDELILRGACKDASEYRKRIAPKALKDEFFDYGGKVWRWDGSRMREYSETGVVTDDADLIGYTSDKLSGFGDIRRCEVELESLMKLLKEYKGAKSEDWYLIPNEDRIKLLKLAGKYKD